MNDIYISWDQFKEDCRVLANKIATDYHPKPFIFGVERDGLFVALQVAHYLGISEVKAIRKDGKIFSAYPYEPRNIKNSLIIDDVYDKGKTFADMSWLCPGIPYYVLYWKRPKSNTLEFSVSNSYFGAGRILQCDGYIYTPWEVK